jgi:hypothetical protein
MKVKYPQKLAQLAQTERWHRELVERYQLQQRTLANANTDNVVEDQSELNRSNNYLVLSLTITFKTKIRL